MYNQILEVKKTLTLLVPCAASIFRHSGHFHAMVAAKTMVGINGNKGFALPHENGCKHSKKV
jgi:hypothetical protein